MWSFNASLNMELTWLGYALNMYGISPEYDKAEAVKEMELPKTIKEVQSHLGLFQFFCELIENYALIAAPLSAVTSPSHPWKSFKISGHLPKEAQEAWHKLIDIISSRPAIAFPDFSLPFQLHVDAAVGQDHHNPPIRGGLGAILTEDATQTGDTQLTHETPEGRTTRSRSNKLPPPIQRFTATTKNYGNHSQPLAIDYHNQNFNSLIEPTSVFLPQTPCTSHGAGAYKFLEEDFAFLFQPISKGIQPFQQ